MAKIEPVVWQIKIKGTLTEVRAVLKRLINEAPRPRAPIEQETP